MLPPQHQSSTQNNGRWLRVTARVMVMWVQVMTAATCAGPVSRGTAERTDRALVRGTRSCPRGSPSTSSCTSPCRPLWGPCTTCVRGPAGSTAAVAAAAAVGAPAGRTALPRWARRRRRPAVRTRAPLATNRGRTTSWRVNCVYGECYSRGNGKEVFRRKKKLSSSEKKGRKNGIRARLRYIPRVVCREYIGIRQLYVHAAERARNNAVFNSIFFIVFPVAVCK